MPRVIVLCWLMMCLVVGGATAAAHDPMPSWGSAETPALSAGTRARAWVADEGDYDFSGTDAPVYDFRVVADYPHDPEAFTQGLVYVDETLYEGTGREGRSTLRRVDLESGEVRQSRALADPFFGEGIAVQDDRIYQLTWKNETCFVYDRETFDLLETFTYPTEGWGLTTDGERLIMSDGSDVLTLRDPETFAAIERVQVHDDGQPIRYLNELEWVDGEVWANVYTTDLIVRIDPESGRVVGWIDLSGLLSNEERAGTDVLNGIAHDPASGRVFVTGKLWPRLFEIELAPR